MMICRTGKGEGKRTRKTGSKNVEPVLLYSNASSGLPYLERTTETTDCTSPNARMVCVSVTLTTNTKHNLCRCPTVSGIALLFTQCATCASRCAFQGAIFGVRFNEFFQPTVPHQVTQDFYE